MRNERLRVHLSPLARERPILERRDWTLVDPRRPVGRKVAKAGAIRLTTALREQAVLGVQQPERGPHAVGCTGHTE